MLLSMNFVSGFKLELRYISLIVYQVKPQSSPWFPAACAAAIVHRNHPFCLEQKNKYRVGIQGWNLGKTIASRKNQIKTSYMLCTQLQYDCDKDHK